jgi:hypothetical protein
MISLCPLIQIGAGKAKIGKRKELNSPISMKLRVLWAT